MDFAAHLPHVLWSRNCPLCSSIRFEAAESSHLDGLLSLLMLRPVRCINCWRRYYLFLKADAAVQ